MTKEEQRQTTLNIYNALLQLSFKGADLEAAMAIKHALQKLHDSLREPASNGEIVSVEEGAVNGV